MIIKLPLICRNFYLFYFSKLNQVSTTEVDKNELKNHAHILEVRIFDSHHEIHCNKTKIFTIDKDFLGSRK